MHGPDDIALLQQFAETNSEAAFAALVTRHVNLVYSVAVRNVGNPHQAEEVAQAVFIILARKAHRLRNVRVLSSWLFQTTRLTAANFVRSEIRRARREQEAHMQSALNESGTEVWKQIVPVLDAAVAGLNEKDRQAVVLRFYEGRNLREIGDVLGTSEDAAYQRVNRAVEKLRQFFTKRGLVLSTTGLTAAISANSVQAAPVGLTTRIGTTTAQGPAAATSTLSLAIGTLKLMAWCQVKNAVSVGLKVLLVAGVATVITSAWWRGRESHRTTLATASDLSRPPNEPDLSLSRAEQFSRLPTARVRRPARVAVASQDPTAQLIYPTAPKFSAMLAAAQTNEGGTRGVLTIPFDLTLQNQYGNLFQILHLTPDQVAAFIKILADKQAQSTVVMRAHSLDRNTLIGLTDAQVAAVQQEHQRQLQVLLQPTEQAAESQIKQLLGNDDSYRYYQNYADQQKERMVLMNGYRDGLEEAGVPPLTLDEVERLVALAYQYRIVAGKDLNSLAQQAPQVLQQAASFLTPDQVQVLAKYMPNLTSSRVATGNAIVVTGTTSPRN